MKKRIGVLTIVLLTVAALGVMSALEGCVTKPITKTTTTDTVDPATGAVIGHVTVTETDAAATAAQQQAQLANTKAGIELAMAVLDDALAKWQQAHPAATAEEKAAEQARKDAKQAELRALLQQVIGGALTPKAAEQAKTVIVNTPAK